LKRILKKIIPQSFVLWVRDSRENFDRRFIRLFAWNRFLSSLYYALFSRKFDREHQGVLQGRLAYWKSLQAIGNSCALLRRNTHRLEKGLIMQPRRPVFAEAYIGETVACYETAVQSDQLCGEELKWATEVLQEYFSVVENTAVIEPLRTRFEKAVAQAQATSAVSRSSIPYPHKSLPQPQITTEQLELLYKRRRSTRWYQEKPVPDELIRKAINMASLAPSACNRQPYEFHVCNSPEQAAKVANFAMGTTGFSQNLQSLVVVVGDLNAYPAERDRHCIYIDASLASMQFMLSLETMGLSSCPINWPDIEAREQLMQRELNLPVYKRPVMLIAVGYADPDGGIPFSQKKQDDVLMKNVGEKESQR